MERLHDVHSGGIPIKKSPARDVKSSARLLGVTQVFGFISARETIAGHRVLQSAKFLFCRLRKKDNWLMDGEDPKEKGS